MRLWHYSLIPSLPRQQLLGQHRECCALRGNGWGKKHATVDYVFTHSPMMLFYYHLEVMAEMVKRGYHADKLWYICNYRGKQCKPWNLDFEEYKRYPEHDDRYLQECIDNLRNKNIEI